MAESQISKQPIEKLWADYLFLTKELSKFIAVKDFELFSEILEQREKLQGMIDAVPSGVFIASPQGKVVMAEIAVENRKITARFECLINMVKRQNDVSNAYDSYASLNADGNRYWST